MIPEETKFCPKCEREKQLDTFGKNRSRPDGLQAWCKVCSKHDQRKRRRTTRVGHQHSSSERILNGEPKILTQFPPET